MYASTIAHGRHLSLSFYLPPSVGLLLTVWTRFYVRVYDRAWEASFALFLSTVEHWPTQVQFSEHDHTRATRANLLAGMLTGPRMSALYALHLERFFVLFFSSRFFCLFFSSSLRTNITHAQPTIHLKTSS